MFPPNPIRVFLVDDHPMFRAGVAQVLAADPRFELVGECGDAPSARAAIDERVDVALVDLSLRSGSGLDLLQALRAERPTVRCLVFSMHDENLYAERALRAGARGYLTKDAGAPALCAAIARVARGDFVLSDRVQTTMISRLAGGGPPSPSPLTALTDREIEVLRLFAAGVSAVESAKTLHISVKTVETHRANIRRKLGAASSASLLRLAIAAFPDLGLGGGDAP